MASLEFVVEIVVELARILIGCVYGNSGQFRGIHSNRQAWGVLGATKVRKEPLKTANWFP